MGVWLHRISRRIGGTPLKDEDGYEMADNGDRLNVHLAEDGTVRHVDFK